VREFEATDNALALASEPRLWSADLPQSGASQQIGMQ